MPKKLNEIVTYIQSEHDEVTGSQFMLTIKMPDKTVRNIMIDCGLFQEVNYSRLNYSVDINVEKIDAIIITHNHMDHVGRIPQLVNKGYNNPIYTSNYTKELMGPFLHDSARHQSNNILEIKKLYPNEKFTIPYTDKDVEATLNLVQGVDFYKSFEIEEGIKVTLFPNGHLIGAALVLIQISYYGAKSVNFLFTGDYKENNTFFNVPPLPRWVRELPLTIVTEATYGHTEKEDRPNVFNNNIREAIVKDQDILIGCFAQGRFQEVLYRIKYLQEIGIIPDSYEICLDGPLGIETCFIYRRLLSSSYNHYGAIFDPDITFMPKNVRFITQSEREEILADKKQKIVVTTSGMLTHGPATTYVPIFVEKDSLIHLTGYAADGTLARNLIDSFENEMDEIEINGCIYQAEATVKATSEFSSHATATELISFLKQFQNLKFVIINHGETQIKELFKDRVEFEVNTKNCEIINRSKVFVIGAHGLKKSMNSKKDCFFVEPVKNSKNKKQNCPNKKHRISCLRK